MKKNGFISVTVIYTFFLVTDEELKKLDTNEHNYY